MGFSFWLESELKRRGLTHSELAKQAGLAQSAVSTVVSGRKPGVSFCLKVAGVFNMPPETVLRLAGILPDSTPAAPVDNPLLKELTDIAADLPPAQREKLLAFARFLKQGGG